MSAAATPDRAKRRAARLKKMRELLRQEMKKDVLTFRKILRAGK